LSTAIALLSGGLDAATAAARISAQLDLAEHHTISVILAAQGQCDSAHLCARPPHGVHRHVPRPDRSAQAKATQGKEQRLQPAMR